MLICTLPIKGRASVPDQSALRKVDERNYNAERMAKK